MLVHFNVCTAVHVAGFQDYAQEPYVMFTTLRNPLELFVSGQQYLNRKMSQHFAEVSW